MVDRHAFFLFLNIIANLSKKFQLVIKIIRLLRLMS